MWTDEQLVEKAEGMCATEGHELLYLTHFGSRLYGTNTEASDTDVKGIFLPSTRSLFLGKTCKHLSFKSKEGDGKNSPDDVDIQLWSVQYWFKLLGMGDTNALDLLYAHTNPKCFLQDDWSLVNDLLEIHRYLYDPAKVQGYLGYIMQQTKKYSIKGSRLNAIKKVYDWLTKAHPKILEFKLDFWMTEILAECGDASYCFEKVVNGSRSLVLCGKVHMGGITMQEFATRVTGDFERYGQRAIQAASNEGVDWKAVSHALRCLYQMHQLLTTGWGVSFPLPCADKLLEVKQGKVPWADCEKILVDGLEEIKALQDAYPPEKNLYDPRVGDEFILSCYVEV